MNIKLIQFMFLNCCIHKIEPDVFVGFWEEWMLIGKSMRCRIFSFFLKSEFLFYNNSVRNATLKSIPFILPLWATGVKFLFIFSFCCYWSLSSFFQQLQIRLWSVGAYFVCCVCMSFVYLFLLKWINKFTTILNKRPHWVNTFL